MIHLKKRPLLNGLSALVLHQIVLLQIAQLCGGQSQAADQPQPIAAMLGDDVILPCHLEPHVDAVSMTLEWARSDLEPRFVHVRRDGVELLVDQNPLYVGRTSLSTSKLKNGDLSLRLSRVKLSDEGTYKCFVPRDGVKSLINLVVGSVSSPVIRFSKLSGDVSGVVLDCKSKGWYPEPEVLWLDAEGNLLSAGPTETVRGPDDLYTVSSRVTVEKRHSNSFTCRVQQKDINQTREALIEISDDLFVVPSCSFVRILIVLVVGFMCIFAVGLSVCIMGRKKIKTKMHYEDENEPGEREKIIADETERQCPMGSETETKPLKTKDKESGVDEEKLHEELEKNEGELKEVQQVIKALNKQKVDLKKQREKVDRTFLEVIKDAYKDETRSRREKAREEILEITDKLMRDADEVLLKMTEMKVRLEKEKQQVNKKLRAKPKEVSDETSVPVTADTKDGSLFIH